MGVEEEYSAMDNDTVNLRNSLRCYFARDLNLTVTFSFMCVVCIGGLVGNGVVIWLLGFRLKRNPFTTYILHLAVADFGVLITIPLMYIIECFVTGISHTIFTLIVAPSVIQIMYSAGQFLLTTISIDRCVCVLFPLWYRCHRPKTLSIILCAIIWLISFLVNVICIFLNASVQFIYRSPVFYVFLMNAMVCLPLITISTLILVIRICCKPKLRQQGKLLMAILLSLFFFLTLAFPMNVILLINTVDWNSFFLNPYYLFLYGWLCTSLNSFVNPLIYFLVGRKKRDLCRENMKLILQRVFMEEEVRGVELELKTQTLH
ncbi:mas-related G-protein coupled receptor member H-like [Tiliqua scincoides]|uniref:mas-related G-protein coupled receptor member H-like n=1 Tax=Tiliqua scincoides TaxID=71010 RepID=UPI0034627EA7